MDKESKLVSRDYILVMIAACGTNFVNFSFFSTLPLFANLLTGTATFAGYMSLAYSATALVVRPVAGLLSDRIGRVRIIVIGAALAAVSCVLYGMTTSIVLLLLIRVLNGAGMSLNATCAGAAVPDIVPEEKMGKGIGIFGLNATVAQALGPMIAIAIVGSGESLSSFRKLFFVAAGFCGISFISGCNIRYERGRKGGEPPKQEAMAASEPGKQEEKTIFGFERQVFAPAFVAVLYFLGVSSILTFVTLYGKERGFQVENLGWFFLISACGVLLSRLLVSGVVDKRGEDVVIMPALLVMVASLAAIPFVPSLPYLLCLAIPYGLASGSFMPAINTTMFRRCSPKRRGAVSAVNNLAIDIGITIGAPVMGRIADSIGFSWVFWTSAALVCLSFLFFILYASDKQYSRREAKKTHE